MSVKFLISQAKNIQIVIDENASEIETLDQNIGDGDHIFNVQRAVSYTHLTLPTICSV